MKIWRTLTSDNKKAAYVEQEQLEMFALDEGIARYRAERLRNDPSNGTAEQQLIGRCLDTLIPAVEQLQISAAEGNALKGVTYWGYPLLSLPADKLAFLTLAEIINHADSPESSTATIASAIGNRAKVEREFALIRQEAPDVYDRVKKRNKKWTRRAHRTAKAKAGQVDADWPLVVRMWLGMTLLERAVEYTNILVVERASVKGKTMVRVHLNPEVRTVIEKAHSECELLRPFYLPMVVPPCEWGDQRNGGYIYHRVPLVKPSLSGMTNTDRDQLDMPRVRSAINHLQTTEWQINRSILPIMKKVWESGGGWAGMPSATPLPVPKPTFDWDTVDDATRAEWKLGAMRIHDEEARLKSKRKAVAHKLWIAERFAGMEVIYFPYQLDWRGRCYPISSHLHPQADDQGRALLQFAWGKSLGSEGLKWLKVHLANSYGVDKVPFAERIRWVDAMLPHIRKSAENPYDYRWWCDGDDPWQSLAACQVIANANEETVCRVPVQVDGSCNGLQHFSAMGRDVVGGRAVNLIPSDKPNDVYQQVADRVNALIEKDLCSDQTGTTTTTSDLPLMGEKVVYQDMPMPSKTTPTGLRSESKTCSTNSTRNPDVPSPSLGTSTPSPVVELIKDNIWEAESSSSLLSTYACAIAWHGHVDRKVVKRATMTIVYGLTKQGMKTQFIEDGHCDSLDGSMSLNAGYLRDKTWEALEGVLTGAAAIMDWLRTVASMSAAAKHSVRWHTPVGFYVIQEYLEHRVRHLYTAMQKLTIREPDPEGDISIARQIRGMPPNFVHSFDAAHMMLTTLACLEYNITDLSMIHDSYGTHAADIPLLAQLIRREFVRMYSKPILTQLHQQWCEDTGLALPPPPPVGELDLEVVLASPYFFA